MGMSSKAKDKVIAKTKPNKMPTTQEMTGAEIANLDNPRNEDAENDLHVRNDQFLGLGLNPTTLDLSLIHI